MIQAFYILLVAVFGSLAFFTLVSAAIRANVLKEELDQVREDLDHREGRIREIRVELQSLDFDISVFEAEKQTLELRENCMRGLEKEHLARMASADEEQSRNP